MLRTLTINNIALIKHTEIEFQDGLNILTGETGAGKSIIIDSLNFVLGARADKSLIRHGESEAVVEAEFDSVNSHVASILDLYDIECEDGLIITRKMTVDGKNTCRINGIKLTVSGLREIAKALVDIYGQNENSLLLDVDTHINIIDKFKKDDIFIVKADYEKAYRNYKQVLHAIKKYSAIENVALRLDILEKQIREIKDFNVTIGEEDELVKQCEMFENSDNIMRTTNEVYNMLSGDSDTNVIDLLSMSIKRLYDISSYDSEVDSLVDRLESAKIEISDIASSVSSIGDRVDIDEYEAEEKQARLRELHNLEAKYGNTESIILSYLEKIEKEYDELGNVEYELDRLRGELDSVYKDMYEKGMILSNARRKCASEFESLVVSELRELGMPNTTFCVNIDTLSTKEDISNSAGLSGFDNVEFLISPNAGEPLKPLNKVISGGEMSRFMLAIKKISAELDGVNVMVFDEIDTGISGKIAQVVANKLYDISVSKQVLAVTHLPQLASMADSHFLIEKNTDNITTSTNIRLLDFDESVLELAKMIDGIDSGSELGKLHAKNLKENAKIYKNSK